MFQFEWEIIDTELCWFAVFKQNHCRYNKYEYSNSLKSRILHFYFGWPPTSTGIFGDKGVKTKGHLQYWNHPRQRYQHVLSEPIWTLWWRGSWSRLYQVSSTICSFLFFCVLIGNKLFYSAYTVSRCLIGQSKYWIK